MNNKKEIIWNLVNAGLAGSLVFLGALTSGTISKASILIAVVASAVVIITKFKDYWATEQNEYSSKVFNFITS